MAGQRFYLTYRRCSNSTSPPVSVIVSFIPSPVLHLFYSSICFVHALTFHPVPNLKQIAVLVAQTFLKADVTRACSVEATRTQLLNWPSLSLIYQ